MSSKYHIPPYKNMWSIAPRPVVKQKSEIATQKRRVTGDDDSPLTPECLIMYLDIDPDLDIGEKVGVVVDPVHREQHCLHPLQPPIEE